MLSLNVIIIGAGYVGLTTAVSLAYLGHHITAIDIDEKKIDALKNGISPIHEPHIETLLKIASLGFTTSLENIASADVIMICVGTPPAENGQANLKHVEEVALSLGQQLQADREYVIVVKSTVPVGTANRVRYLIQNTLDQRKIETKLHVVSNPEFLREGVALFDMFYPDRIVVGVDDEAAASTLWQLYRPLLEQSFDPPEGLPRPEAFSLPAYVVVDTASSEIIKYAANAFLATKISFINEMAGLCEKVGADVREVARGIGLDKRIGLGFLQAGIGWGGSCFGKDTLALIKTAEEYHYPMALLQATRTVNYAQRHWVITKLQEFLKTLRGRTIGLLGLAFKPNTDDVRDAPSLDVIRQLIELGANVQIHDPAAIPNTRQALSDVHVQFCDQAAQVFERAHAVVLLTEWKAYQSLPFSQLIERMQTPLLLDGRNYLDHASLYGQGYKVIGVGYPCESV